MKTLFIEARRKFSDVDFSELGKIKYKKIGLLASLQYIDLIHQVKRKIEGSGKKVFLAGGNAKYAGQILGCDVSAASAVKEKVDAFLLLGSGKFHALNVAALGKPVLIWHPGSGIVEFPHEEIRKINARKKANIIRLLSSDAVGVIVSTKLWQEKLNQALEIKRMLEKKGKKAFIFISDTVQKNELENFDVKIWINTACPNLVLDIPNAINLESLYDVYK